MYKMYDEEMDYEVYCEREIEKLMDVEPLKRYRDTTSFPLEPINPTLLYERVKAQLMLFKLKIVPSKSQEMIEDMGKGFNECIRLNHSSNSELPQTIIYSPKTGSGKSVVAKMYISMLKQVNSLVVVPKVSDANEFCEDINNWSGNPNHARCHYSINSTNTKSENHIDKFEVVNHSCIVITHAMYILINKNQDLKLFELLQSRDSKLVVIDERISLYNRFVITNEQIDELMHLCEVMSKNTKYNLSDDIATLKSLSSVFDELNTMARDVSKTDIFISKSKQISDLEIVPPSLNEISQLLENDTIIDVRDFLTKLPGISMKETKQDVKRSILELIDIIKMIGVFDFSFHKSGGFNSIMFTSEIEPLFGSVVVLDATATANEIYNQKAEHSAHWVQHIKTVDPRIYNSLTIYKAKGYNQGREAVYKNQTVEGYQKYASTYIKLANSLMTSLNDKILIITFKDFIMPLEKHTKGTDRIMITNWGNHVGKNEWSDCNKVMIIGWYRLPITEYYGNFINTLLEQELEWLFMEDDTLKKFRETQLIDDLVQATMRSSARRMVDTNGDCQKTEVYFFYPDNKEGSYIMSEYEKEFKGAKVVDWSPQNLLATYKPSKSNTNIDTILSYLDTKLINNEVSIKNIDIINDTALTKSVVGRTIKQKNFIEQLELRGYHTKLYNKQSKAFYRK